MGKAAKSMRHIEKMKKRKADKAAKVARYAALAGTGNNSKRKHGNAIVKAHLKVRDVSCKNIGDILSHTGVERVAFEDRILRMGSEYRGRYKSLRRDDLIRTAIEHSVDVPKYMLRNHLGQRLEHLAR